MDRVKRVAKSFFLATFILTLTALIGFASSLYISTPETLGSGSAAVKGAPVKVVKANWLICDEDPSRIRGVMIHFRSIDDAAHSVTVYVAVKDSGGAVLSQASGNVDVKAEGETPAKFIFYVPAEKVASLTVTVLGG